MKNTKTMRLPVVLMVVLCLILGMTPVNAATTSSYLVNTESFFIIDDGDGTTNIQLQFGDTVAEIIEWDVTNNWFNFTSHIHVEGNAYIDGDLTLDHHDAGGDVTINFGGSLGEFIQWDSLNSRFNISDNLYVDGGVEVNGNIDFNQNLAVEMVIDQGLAFPVAPVAGQLFYLTTTNTLYYWDGANWVAPNVGGSDTLFLVPVWPDTTYFADGTANVGTLTNNYDSVNNHNYYRWRSTRPALQNYDIVSQLQLPYNFTSWDGTVDVTFVIRTTTTNTADNSVTLQLYDTAGVQNLAGNTGLVSSVANTWRTYTFTIAAGTWNPGDFLRIVAKGYSRAGNNTDIGYVILKFNAN